MKKVLTLVMALSVALLAGPAYAVTVGGSGSSAVTVGASLPGASASSASSAGVDVNATGGNSSAGAAQDSSVHPSDYTGASVTNVLPADVASDSNVPLLSSVSSVNVSSDKDLSTYAKAVVKGDENVSNVQTGPDKVSVTYKERAWLFGFIPAVVQVRADASSDGSVAVHYPWYSFLMKTSKDSLESSLHASVAALLNANSHSAFNAHTQAMLVESMRTALKNNFDADSSGSLHAKANADANANANANVEGAASTNSSNGAASTTGKANAAAHANAKAGANATSSNHSSY